VESGSAPFEATFASSCNTLVTQRPHYRDRMRALGLLAFFFFSACAHAQLYTCIESGNKVIRQQPCSEVKRGAPDAPPSSKPAAVAAKSVTTSTPIFSQVFVFSLPGGFKPAHENSTPASYMMEFIPQDQTLASWRDMITVQGFRGLARSDKGSPKNLLTTVSSHMEKACGSQALFYSLGDSKVDSFDAYAAIMGCAKIGDRSEIAYYLAIKGREDLYLIQRAFRGAPFDKSRPPVSGANAESIVSVLQPIKICERSEPQGQCWSRKSR
jgi:hypothetical protein